MFPPFNSIATPVNTQLFRFFYHMLSVGILYWLLFKGSVTRKVYITDRKIQKKSRTDNLEEDCMKRTAIVVFDKLVSLSDLQSSLSALYSAFDFILRPGSDAVLFMSRT